MTTFAIITTCGVYLGLAYDALNSYKKGENAQRPKPWIQD